MDVQRYHPYCTGEEVEAGGGGVMGVTSVISLPFTRFRPGSVGFTSSILLTNAWPEPAPEPGVSGRKTEIQSEALTAMQATPETTGFRLGEGDPRPLGISVRGPKTH